MVFEVKKNQQLSQTNVKTMSQRCTDLISRAACIPQIRTAVITPVLEYYAGQNPSKTLANDSVFLAWCLIRQGTMLCMLLNNFRSGILDKFYKLKVNCLSEAVFSDSEAKSNIKVFLAACKGDLYMTEDQLFACESLYTNDTNTLSKAIAMSETFFVRISRTQNIDFPKKITELGENDKLYSLFEEEGDAAVPEGVKLRLRVLQEMLKTEQQYVADIEKLQAYAEELRMDEIIPAASLSAIFANLDQLIDFQRHFLMKMEATMTKAVLTDVDASYKAGIGKLFSDNEKGFEVYETFCGNYHKASECIGKEMQNLIKKENVMDPNVQLNAYIIKPTQRICKYPLLIRELIKMSDKDAPDLKELEVAHAVVNNVTIRVNDKKREQEMALISEELFGRIKDWKSVDKSTLGLLMLNNTGIVTIGDNGKEMELYLYEKILLICGKSKSMTDRLSGNTNLAKPPLVIKGFINVTQMVAVTKPINDGEGGFSFKITYKNGSEVETCTVKLSMEESVKKWSNEINRLIEGARPAPKPVIPTVLVAGGKTAEDRRRRSVVMAQMIPMPMPNTLSPNGKATIAAATDDEPICLKIHHGTLTMVEMVQEDIVSLSQLKGLVLNKVKKHYHRIGMTSSNLTADKIDLMQIDSDKDEIQLLDDDDVLTAMVFSPIKLNVRILEK